MRRTFCRIAAMLALLAMPALAAAQSTPVAGKDYLVLDPPRLTAGGQAIEVIEFFYYGCPVCYESQPHIAHWLANAGDDVVLTRIPSATFADAESFALTFYALEASGDLAQLHGAVYENHHFDDRRLNRESSLLEWLGRNGVDAEAFRRLRDSAQIRERVAAVRKAYEAYNIRGVPAFAVDGKFVTSARLAGGVKEMMAVVAWLVGRAREQRRPK